MEIWKEIKGFENYKVSNLGRVKSCKKGKEKFLRLNLDSGYLRVGLSSNGKGKIIRIHQLVAIAFLNHTPCGYKLVVDHINGVKTDNRLENLQVITQRENASKDKKGGSSKYTGVSWSKRDKKWLTHIRINGKVKHLGTFTDELEAAQAYKIALRSL
tara:strand:- start:130 stop:600 length:471 start_codon:yes stop_codon:yes gene_type:complete